MAAVLTRHDSLFLPNLVILMVQICRLCFGDFAFLAFLVNALVLAIQPAVYLDPARVILRPSAGGGRRAAYGCGGDYGNEGEGQQLAGKLEHDFLLEFEVCSERPRPRVALSSITCSLSLR